MQLGWGLLTMVILAAAVLWFWQDSLAARESANAAAMEACSASACSSSTAPWRSPGSRWSAKPAG